MDSKNNKNFFPINIRTPVDFHGDRIETLLTSDKYFVDKWIAETYRIAGVKFVGLDTEWIKDRETKQYEVAVLQLCVEKRCLVYQVSLNKTFPQSLVDFLADENLIFVGKEIHNEDVKLLARRGLHVKCAMDVAHMAAIKEDHDYYKSMGLKNLASIFLRKEMEKDRDVTTSYWGYKRLSFDQAKYASIDAYVSLRLGEELRMETYSSEEIARCIAVTREACRKAFAPSRKEIKKRRKRNQMMIDEEKTEELSARLAAGIEAYSFMAAPTGWDV